MDQSTHDVRLAQWRDIVVQCHNRPEGTTAKAWLAERDINEKQYYYYQRLIRNEAFEEMKADCLPAPKADASESSAETSRLPSVQNRGHVAFAEIPAATVRGISVSSAQSSADFHPNAVIHTGLETIELSNSISESLLRSILEVMCHA